MSRRTEILALLLPAALLAVAALTPRLKVAQATTKMSGEHVQVLRACTDPPTRASRRQGPRGFAFDTAAGVRHDDSAWMTMLDGELATRRVEIRPILEGCDVPLVESGTR